MCDAITFAAAVVCVSTGITRGLDKHDERDDTQWKTGTVTGR